MANRAGLAVLRIIWLWLFMLAGAAEAAGPAEPPPENFAGAQFIDSVGCVFTRKGDAWAARLGPDDRPVCGWPPSLSARRTDPDTSSVLPPANPPKPPGVEEQLMTALAAGLRDGEFVADGHQAEHRHPPAAVPKPTEGPLSDLNAIVAAAPAVDAAMSAALRPGDRLCQLLGDDGVANRLPELGGDPTGGFCPGIAPVVLPRQTAQMTGAGVVDAPAARPAARTRPVKTASIAAPKTTPKAIPRAPARVSVEMIPPGARFVLIGRFDSDAAAQGVILRISALGYPVSRGRIREGAAPQTLILAGPFNDRQKIVAALNDLRGRGFAAAVAR